MNPHEAHLLTVNAGSSSVKLTLFAIHDTPKRVFDAAVENIGQPTARLVVRNKASAAVVADHFAATQILIDLLERSIPKSTIAAIGHRIVHGGSKYHKAKVIDDQMLLDLRDLSPFDPGHLSVEIQLIELFGKLFSDAKQIACFDTAFHHDLPIRAQLLPIPRRFAAEGIRRYGFHGLSYAFILQELKQVEGETAAKGKVIIAHLGSGVSLAALREGKSIDTTMSMTPASGIPMSTRSGDLDPGLALYFARTQGYDANQFNHMTNFESGLLGISETTADMESLLEIEATDPRAKDAIDIFCYHIQKSIGSLAAALGGLNTLVFTGGMGENAPKIRVRVCENLEFLGVTLDATRNKENERLISVEGSAVGVHVIHTDEAATIAHETAKLIER